MTCPMRAAENGLKESNEMDREKQIEEMANDLNDCIIEFVTDVGDVYIDDEATAQKMFDKGYRKQSKLISVEDDLPKNQLERVLVFLKDDEFTKPIGFNKIDTDRYIDGKWVRWGKSVTHWMTLPEPPKMDKEE